MYGVVVLIIMCHYYSLITAWPKSDDCELFKGMRKACPKDDAMKYESRVNYLNWESVSCWLKIVKFVKTNPIELFKQMPFNFRLNFKIILQKSAKIGGYMFKYVNVVLFLALKPSLLNHEVTRIQLFDRLIWGIIGSLPKC